MPTFHGSVIAAAAIALCSLTGCSNSGSNPQKVASKDAQAIDETRAQIVSLKQVNDRVQHVGNLETVATFDGPMPTGVTVSQDGRIFVNFPRWGDDVEYTVAELKNGKTVAYPNADINRYSADLVTSNLVCVQSVVVDPLNRLWAIDTGSLHLGPVAPGAAKLVGIDLATNQIVKTIHFPPEVALKTSYLNDIRFDLRRGTAGIAYITDSSSEGPNGIVVVDLDTGRSWRRLTGHPSVKGSEGFAPIVEGRPLMQRPTRGTALPLKMGSDGIAISGDGQTLYYCPLASRHLYSVSTDALADPNATDAQAASLLRDLGDRGYASDGLESDAAGNIYLTDYEHNAVHRRTPEGKDTIIAQDPRLIWPDTMSVASDGFLYVTANQLDRQKNFNEGHDLRQKPYYLFRVKIDAQPVMLKK